MGEDLLSLQIATFKQKRNQHLFGQVSPLHLVALNCHQQYRMSKKTRCKKKKLRSTRTRLTNKASRRENREVILKFLRKDSVGFLLSAVFPPKKGFLSHRQPTKYCQQKCVTPVVMAGIRIPHKAMVETEYDI